MFEDFDEAGMKEKEDLKKAVFEENSENPEKRGESDLPVNCKVQFCRGNFLHIRGRKVFSFGKQTDEIYPCEGKFGVYYRFEQHNNAILTKSRNGTWLLKEKFSLFHRKWGRGHFFL